jgi:hypothetical protein
MMSHLNAKSKKMTTLLEFLFLKVTKLNGWVFLTRGHICFTKSQGIE